MTPEEHQEFEELKAEVKALRTTSTIPFEVENAFRDRLRIANAPTVSAKGNQTESIPVNTAAGTLVQLFPDVFLEVTVNGVTYYIPAYT